MTLRIVLLAHNLQVGGGRSVGVNLIRALPIARPDVEFLMVVPEGSDYDLEPSHSRATLVRAPSMGLAGRLMWETKNARQLAESFGADWIVALGNIPITSGQARSAVLLHDPHLFYPREVLKVHDKSTRIRKTLLRAYLHRALQRVEVVFAQTPSAAKRIASMYGVRSCVILPNAVSLLIDETDDRRSFLLPEGKFRFLTLTRYYAHKNLEVLVEMMSRFRAELEDVVGILTISQEDHPRVRRLVSSIQELGLTSNLVNIGHVDQSSLGALYSQVDAVVLPTLLESFSGTYVEAMKFGVPIITSDRDFARDVCGSAAVYFDPLDPASIAGAIIEVSGNSVQRSQLIAAGHDRLRALESDWVATAADLVETLESSE